jgi:putative oxidoreductase
MKAIVVIGRLLFSLIFILSGFHHFSDQAIEYGASKGVPLASFAVPFAGLMAIVGGLSVALGLMARVGAVLIILFLVPVTVMMHDYWNVVDPMIHQMQMNMFMKNSSMLGGAVLIAWFGSGPWSLDDARIKKNGGD